MHYEVYEINRICYEKGISFETRDIIMNILDRIENPNDDEDILNALDDELIYYEDQWTILKEYCQPTKANWDTAIEEFISALFSIVAEVQKE